MQAAGDESGLGRQICWEAAERHAGRFLKVNFSSRKHDLGFALMNQLSVVQKRFPRSEQDIAADYFALLKTHSGTRWALGQGRNPALYYRSAMEFFAQAKKSGRPFFLMANSQDPHRPWAGSDAEKNRGEAKQGKKKKAKTAGQAASK